MSDPRSLFGASNRDRLFPAFWKFLIYDFLGVLIGVGSSKPIYELFHSEEPLSLPMKIWLGVSLIFIFIWLLAKVYERLVDVKYGGASIEQVRELTEQIAESERSSARLVREAEEMRIDAGNAKEERKLWEQRANRFFLSSEALNTDIQHLIDKLHHATPRQAPTKEWYCRRFLSSVATLMSQLSREPGQTFRSTLMEWAGEENGRRFMKILYYHCPSTEGNCISWRNKTPFFAGDGTLAGYVLENGHEIALQNIPEERRLAAEGKHPVFKDALPFRQLHDQQDYIKALLCIPIRVRSDRASDTLFVLSIDSNKSFFEPVASENIDKFFTLLKPWIKSLVFYTRLLSHHDDLEKANDEKH